MLNRAPSELLLCANDPKRTFGGAVWLRVDLVEKTETLEALHSLPIANREIRRLLSLYIPDSSGE